MADFNKNQLNHAYRLWWRSYIHSLHDYIAEVMISHNDDIISPYVTSYWLSGDFNPVEFSTDDYMIMLNLKSYSIMHSHREKTINYLLIKYGKSGGHFIEYVHNTRLAYLNIGNRLSWVFLKEINNG